MFKLGRLAVFPMLLLVMGAATSGSPAPVRVQTPNAVSGGVPAVATTLVAEGGAWLFFDSLRDGNRDIYATLADGSSLKRITTSAAVEREPSVSPDGRTLAFSSNEAGTFQIILLTLATGQQRPLTNRSGGADQPAWSPDSRSLAYHSGRGVWIIDVEGTNDHLASIGIDEFNANQHAVFTPDGKAILVDRGNQIHRVDLTTGRETPVVHNTTTTVQHPSVSPDGRMVAYSIICFPGISGIWLAPLAEDTIPCMGGLQVTNKDEAPARFPSFSPTGLIAFEHGNDNARIGVIDPGHSAKDITSGGDDRNPSWSPASTVLP